MGVGTAEGGGGDKAGNEGGESAESMVRRMGTAGKERKCAGGWVQSSAGIGARCRASGGHLELWPQARSSC